MAQFKRKRRFSRFSRKRRLRSTWFPTNGTQWVNGPDTWWDAGFAINSNIVDPVLGVGPDTQYVAVTRDFTLSQEQAALETGASLRDQVEGQTFLLQRLVGNLYIQAFSDATDNDPLSWPYIKVGAGFFIARQEDGIVGAPDLFGDEMDVLNVNNIQNPWIWRNTWILRNPNSPGPGLTGLDYPVTTAGYHGFQAPHFDSKIKRKIVREHRLWFVMSTIGWDGLNFDKSSGEFQPYARAYLDLRILGRMARGRNQSSF